MMKKNKEKTVQKVYKTPKYICLTILCIFLTLILTTFLLTCMTLRYYVKTAAIPEAVTAVAIEKIQIPQSDGSKKSVAEYILDEYVQDERVTVEDVEKVLEDGTFSDFAGALIERYNTYLADGGTFPEIDSDEFISLVEENSDLIYDKTGLRFLDPDKKKLKQNLSNPLEFVNHMLESYMYKGVKGFFLRLAVSVWSQVLLIVLMCAVLAWLIVIHIRGQKRVGTAFEVYSITAFLPCAVIFMGGILMSWLLSLISLPEELGTVLRGRTITFSGIGMLICAVLFGFGKLWNLISEKPAAIPVQEKTPVEEQIIIPEPREEQNSVSEKLFSKPSEPESVKPELPKVSLEKDVVPPRLFCRYCGQKLTEPDSPHCPHCNKAQ